jgi:hypothetical protein
VRACHALSFMTIEVACIDALRCARVGRCHGLT